MEWKVTSLGMKTILFNCFFFYNVILCLLHLFFHLLDSIRKVIFRKVERQNTPLQSELNFLLIAIFRGLGRDYFIITVDAMILCANCLASCGAVLHGFRPSIAGIVHSNTRCLWFFYSPWKFQKTEDITLATLRVFLGRFHCLALIRFSGVY